MKKLFLLLPAIMALAACAHESPIAGSASGGPVAFATLASFGTFEMQLAPAYTRLAVLRHNAARALRDRRITVAAAVSIQSAADNARSLLDAAHAETLDGKPNPGAVEKLGHAQRLIAAAEKLLERKP